MTERHDTDRHIHLQINCSSPTGVVQTNWSPKQMVLAQEDSCEPPVAAFFFGFELTDLQREMCQLLLAEIVEEQTDGTCYDVERSPLWRWSSGRPQAGRQGY